MSGYSIAGALGGYGYDQYTSPPSWDEETNYNRVARTERPRSFRARVDAKKREMRMAQQVAAAETKVEEPKSKMSEKKDDQCQCLECAPHLYRSEKHPKQECDCHDCKKGGCQSGIFRRMTQQDCLIIFIIIVIAIVLYSMYCTMCRLNDIVFRLSGSPQAPLNPQIPLKP